MTDVLREVRFYLYRCAYVQLRLNVSIELSISAQKTKYLAQASPPLLVLYIFKHLTC